MPSLTYAEINMAGILKAAELSLTSLKEFQSIMRKIVSVKRSSVRSIWRLLKDIKNN